MSDALRVAVARRPVARVIRSHLRNDALMALRPAGARHQRAVLFPDTLLQPFLAGFLIGFF
ncbi:hypothetical protein [Xanthomonas sp. WHRI 7945]|nr:hypothetical protein [Xanthomonas campestris pv. campestris]